MFCVECGREGEVYDGLCAACFLERNRFTRMPTKIDLRQCAHCLEFMIGGGWRPFDSLEEAAIRAALDGIEVRADASLGEVKVDVLPEDGSNLRVSIDAEVWARGLVKHETLQTTVRVKRTSCPRCSKIKGSYFESIIQVRARDRAMDREEKLEVLEEVERRVSASGDRDQFISKVEELHGGFDVYLSSTSLGGRLIRELTALYGAERKESSSLVGVKQGKEVYRVTHLLRLPAYRQGDIVLFRSAPHLVEAIASNRTRLLRLHDHLRLSVDNKDLHDSRVIGHPSDVREAVVVSEGREELQVLHPVTYLTVEVRRPGGMEVGETVRVFLHDGELFMLP